VKSILPNSNWLNFDTVEGRQLTRALLAYIRAQTRNPDLADDVFQETLLRTNKSANFDTLDNPVAYMITVAKSVIYDEQRKVQPQSLDWQNELLEAANDSLENNLLNEQKLQFIQQTLSNMSTLRRNVFVMRRVDGLSRDTIAKKLDISVEAVKKHLTRAMVELTLKLEDAGWGEKDLK
jgi:RNA polymerase sigma-70 factor (ECF subfamily)